MQEGQTGGRAAWEARNFKALPHSGDLKICRVTSGEILGEGTATGGL